MVFFENKENSGKISKGLLGKGTQMPSPSRDPFSSRRCKNPSMKAETVSK
jgi:hypothetical protein